MCFWGGALDGARCQPEWQAMRLLLVVVVYASMLPAATKSSVPGMRRARRECRARPHCCLLSQSLHYCTLCPVRPYGQRRKKNCNALERAALYLQRAAGVLEAVEGAQRVTLSEAVGGQVRRLRLFAYAREQLVLFAIKGSGRGVRGSRGAASTLAVPAGRAGSRRRLEALQRGLCGGGKLRP